MNSPRFFLFLAITCLIFFASGCTTERAGNAGFISVSQPRVWRDEALVTSIDKQLKEINEFGKNVKLDAIQGKRARRFYKVLGLKGAVGLTLPASSPAPTAKPSTQEGTGDGTSTPAADSASIQEEVKVLPKPGLPEYIKISGEADATTEFTFKEFSDIGEEPIDGLQRVDDFYQILEGVRLTHLRDTASMEKEWSAYLLGFDVSLVPGDKTSESYGAQVEFKITGKNEDDSVKDEGVRVYCVWPQRYAERFNEILAVRESFYLALKQAAQAQLGSAELAQNLSEQYREDLALIQRYPLISGFVKGPTSFGWEFNPRVRIKTIRRPILPNRTEPVYWLEPGIRRCYAIVVVNDGRVWAEKFISKMTEEDLKKIAFGGRANLTDLAELKGMYEGVLDSVSVTPHSEHSKELDKLRLLIGQKGLFDNPIGTKEELEDWNTFEERLERWQDEHKKLIELLDRDSPIRKKLSGLNENSMRRLAYIGNEKDFKDVKKLYEEALGEIKQKPKQIPDELQRYFDSFDNNVICVKKADLETWEKFWEWKDFHEHVLKLCGHHGKDGIKKLELKATCKWFHRDSGQEEGASCKPFGNSDSISVELPNKQHRSLEKIWTVWPNRGPINQETTVTIRVTDMSNDARVFVGGMEAKVDVISRNLVVATFPKTGEEILEGHEEKKFPVKVLTAGDSLGVHNAFTYFKPKAKPQPVTEPFGADLDSVTHHGGANTSVRIKANKPVMSMVVEVWFGQYGLRVDRKSCSEDNRELVVTAPAGPGKGMAPVKLRFYPDTNISKEDEYVLPTPFQYE